MKQFKNLDITGPEEQFLGFIDAVSADLPSVWHRDNEAEVKMGWQDREGLDQCFAFNRDATKDVPSANLYLRRKAHQMHISNIVPQDRKYLTIYQYNAILDEFSQILRLHLPTDSKLDVFITSDEAAITDWLSSEAAELLRHFSNLANKGTGASHPSDFERWTRFLIRAHRERSNLDSGFLKRWLVEELEWPEDGASDLARDYAFSRDLLSVYDAAP